MIIDDSMDELVRKLKTKPLAGPRKVFAHEISALTTWGTPEECAAIVDRICEERGWTWEEFIRAIAKETAIAVEKTQQVFILGKP